MGQTSEDWDEYGPWADGGDDYGFVADCPECGGAIFEVIPLDDTGDFFLVNCDGCGSRTVRSEYLSFISREMNDDE